MRRIEIKATVYLDDDVIAAYDDDNIGFDPERLGVDYGWEELQHVALEVTRMDYVQPDGPTPYDADTIESRFKAEATTQ